jgi:hypothetical protein
MKQQPARAIITLGVALVAILGAVWTHHGAKALAPAPPKGLQGVEYLPEPSKVRLLSLGHQPAMADLFWVRAVLYFAENLQIKSQFQWISDYIHIIIALDPDFEIIYKWGGMVMILKSSVVTPEQVFLANEILEKGALRFPEDSSFPMAAAANCGFYVKTQDPDLKKKLDDCQKRFFRMAADRPGAPYYAALLATQDQEDERSCQLLADLLLKNHADPTTRRQLAGRLRHGACATDSLDKLEAHQRRFERVRGAWMPYLSDDLFVQVAPVAQWDSTLGARGPSYLGGLDDEGE